jgi:hypothetical protein
MGKDRSTRRRDAAGVVHEMADLGVGTLCGRHLPAPWQRTEDAVSCAGCAAGTQEGEAMNFRQTNNNGGAVNNVVRAEVPAMGDRAVCRICDQEIEYVGPFWRHLGSAPRHGGEPKAGPPPARFGHHPDAGIDAEVECDRLAGLLAEAQAALVRALDFRAATPEGLAVKADVRDALRRTGYRGDAGVRSEF